MGRSAPLCPLAPGHRSRAQTTQTSPRASPRGGGTPATQLSPCPRPWGQPDPDPNPAPRARGPAGAAGGETKKKEERNRCAVSCCTTATSFYAPATLRQVQQTAASPSPSPGISPPTAAPISSWDKRTGGGLKGVPRKEPQLQGRSSSSRGSRPRRRVSFWPPACGSRVLLLLLLPKGATVRDASGWGRARSLQSKSDSELQPGAQHQRVLQGRRRTASAQHRTGAESPGAASSLLPSQLAHPGTCQRCPAPPCASGDAHGPAAKPGAPCAHSSSALPFPSTSQPHLQPQEGGKWGHTCLAPSHQCPQSSRHGEARGLPRPGGCALGRGPGMLPVLLARSSPFCSRSNLTKSLIKELL